MREFMLDNGIRVYLWPWDATSVGINVTLTSGSRNDPVSNCASLVFLHGLNHAYEHIASRATRSFPSWKALMEKADSTCSDFNAETSKTTLSVYAETDRQHALSTISFLAEIIKHPLISTAHVSYEKARVAQECREGNDDPEERTELDFDQLMFGQDGLAHPIVGTEESIQRFDIKMMWNFYRRTVCGQRLIVVMTGNFDPVRAEAIIRRDFSEIKPGLPPERFELNYRRLRGGIALKRRDTNQVYCLIGFPVFGVNDPRRPAMSLIRNQLSNRSSSQIKIAASSLGFGYSNSDYLMHWSDVGQYHVALPVSPDRFIETLEIVGREIGQIRQLLLPPEDYELSVTNLVIGSRAKFGNPLQAATFVGEFVANAGRFMPLRHYLHSIRRVSRSKIRSVARDIFVHSRLCLVAHGPLQGITKHTIRRALRWSS